jgi:hypothetical protein
MSGYKLNIHQLVGAPIFLSFLIGGGGAVIYFVHKEDD